MQDIIPPRRVSRVSGRSVEAARRLVVYERRSAVVNTATRTTTIIDEELIVPAEPEPILNIVRPIEHLTPDAKTRVLERAMLNAQRELKKERRKRRDMKRSIAVFVAALFVLATGYVSIDTWMTNQAVKAETAQTSASDNDVTQATEGKDETAPSVDHLANYAVASDLPRALYIDKLDIAARVLPMSVNSDNSIQAPRNIYDAGWYTGSVKPGEIGAVFIDGHASGPTRKGLFGSLDRLGVGDTIRVEKGNGETLTYRVVFMETVPLADLDMKRVLLPRGNVLRGLNLMTCTGEWLPDKQTFDHRVVVWAEQIE